MSKNTTKMAAAVGCGLALLACRATVQPAPDGAARPAPAQRTFHVQGVVKELKPDRRTIVIQHEKIPGYMEAMTMPFPVKDPKELAGLQAGDRVTFRMIVNADEGWIDQIQKTAAAPTPAPATPGRPEWRIVREVQPLKVGDPMPDYRFTNQLGQAVRLSQFKGKAVALTFFYTRCPFPDFCPRMSKNFEETYEKLTKRSPGPKNWHLLSISFDPDNDTPAVLRIYATKYRFDPQQWDFVTGKMIDIDAITEQFGMMFARQGTGFDHNLRTVVIDARGQIQRIIVGNTWASDELVSELVKAAAAPGQPDR